MHAFNTVLSLFVVVACTLPALAVPHFLVKRQDATQGNCNLVGQQCCQSLVPASGESGSALTGLLDLDTLDDATGSFGLNCSPVLPTLSGQDGACTGTMVCCTGNSQMSGAVNMGCMPVSL